MKLAEYSVKNSILVNLISFLIIFIGLFSMYNLRKEAFPSVDFDVVTVTTNYPGAPAEDVEKFVTIPIEKEIKGISGIKEIASKSEEGISEIGITIDPKTFDKEQVIDDIERAVDRVKDLPEGVKDDPLVFELKSKEFPVLEISITGNASETEKRQYAEALEDMILDINGVSNIRRLGWLDEEFHVEVYPDKLHELHVSINEIMQALRARNITLPGGYLKTKTQEFNVRTSAEFNTVEEIENVIIRANDAGNWLRVKDVAAVSKGFEERQFIARTEGSRSLGMVVVKNETGDIIKIVDKVNETVESFKKTIPDNIKITTANDLSFYVKRRLGVLQNNGILGFILVTVVLFIFLDPIPALFTAFGIPISLFITFFVMSWAGLSINLISMVGMILVLGMLVDDGIVVSENVYRYVEKGMSPREAAVRGTTEVIAPVTATVLTTFAAFGPLLFVPDIMGKFIKQIPIVVMVALGASLIEAFIFLPSHLADFVRGTKHIHERSERAQQKGWYQKINSFYVKVLSKALRNKYKVLTGLVFTFIGVLFFAFFIYKIKIILFTGEGIEDFYIRAEAPKSTSLERMEELLQPVEKMVASMSNDELDSYRTYIGSISEEHGFDPNAKNGSHLAQITVFLTPMQERSRDAKEIVDSLRPQLQKIEGFEKLYFFQPKEGPPTGRAIEIGVTGDNFETLQEISAKIVDHLKTVEGVSDVGTNYELGKQELRIIINEDKAQKYYLTIDDIASTVRYAFKGGVATSVKPLKAEDEIEVLVRFPQQFRNDETDFEKIYIENRLGNLIPLDAVADIRSYSGVYAITHLDGKRVIWVTGDVDGEKATSFSANQSVKEKFTGISHDYIGYSLKLGGEYEEQKETQANLLFSFIVALFLIFIILTANFGSMVQPFIVMTAIPFGFLGIIIAFMLHGRPLSFFALMGAVSLTGVVVNDSIVLVDFANNLRKEGKARFDSLIEAGQTRLRPVLMTTITTIAGLLSVAYGFGGGDPFLRPLGLAISWGLFFATGLTLIVIPCIYAMFDDIAVKLSRKGDVKTA
jgi:multidrug efflux pump subunit AcrB